MNNKYSIVRRCRLDRLCFFIICSVLGSYSSRTRSLVVCGSAEYIKICIIRMCARARVGRCEYFYVRRRR